MRNGNEMLRVSRVYFYQHDDSDLYEVNERKGENGRLVYRTQKARKAQNFTDLF